MSSPRRTRMNPEARIQQILDEALRLIGEQGFRGFTIQSLARTCDLSNAGLLHYFGSKDAMLLAVLDEIGRRSAAGVSHLVAKGIARPSPDNLLLALRSIAMNVTERPEVSRFTVMLMTESISPDHPAHDWFRKRDFETQGVVERMSRGWHPDPQLLGQQVLAVLHGLSLQWLRSGGQLDLLAASDKTIAGFLAGASNQSIAKPT